MNRFSKYIDARPAEWLGLAVVAVLVFVWPVRGTIALRQILLLAGVLIWLRIWFKSREAKPDLSSLIRPFFWYCVLTGWLLIGAFLISVDTQWSLRELKGQWLRAALTGLLGFLVAAWAVRPRLDWNKARLCVLLFVLPVLAQILFTLADTLWLWASTGYFPVQVARLTGGKLGVSVNINFLFAIVAADLLTRARCDQPLMPVSKRSVLILSALALACAYVIGARNGTFCLVALVVVALGIFLKEQKRSRHEVMWASGILILLAAVAFFNLRADHRWAAFEESAYLAWNTEHNRAWLDDKIFPLPKMQNGDTVDHSSYMRIAWIKEGAKVLIDRPLGVGFGRNAMGQAFNQKYGHGFGGHSDNGFIDFSIGTGVPGIILGGAFLASLMFLGWRTYGATGSSLGLALLFVVLSYLMRTMLDSTTRDNYLEQFMFMAAMFATLSAGAAPGRKR